MHKSEQAAKSFPRGERREEEEEAQEELPCIATLIFWTHLPLLILTSVNLSTLGTTRREINILDIATVAKDYGKTV
jgi:hypothetical protein